MRDIDYSAKLYMIENLYKHTFITHTETGLVLAFKLESDALKLLSNLSNKNNYRVIYAAPCEFFPTDQVLWDAYF